MEIYNQNVTIVYIIIIIFSFYYLGSARDNYKGIHAKHSIIFFSICFLFIFGLRSFDVGTDTRNYIYSFNQIISSKFSVSDFKDSGYYYYVKLIGLIDGDDRFFLLAMAFAFVVPLAVFFIKLPVRNKFLVYFLFISIFSFQNFGINILRQGIASSFILLSLLTYNKKYYNLIFQAIAISFHLSAIIPISIYYLSKCIKRLTIPLFVYASSIVLSFLQFDFIKYINRIPYANILFMDRFQMYYENAAYSSYEIGFRIDFLIFNLIFAILGGYIYRVFAEKNYNSQFSTRIYSSYLLISSLFYLSFNVSYSDRIGAYSWIFIPLLFLPLIQSNSYKESKYILVIIFSVLFFVF